jgi:hypothetical protein
LVQACTVPVDMLHVQRARTRPRARGVQGSRLVSHGLCARQHGPMRIDSMLAFSASDANSFVITRLRPHLLLLRHDSQAVASTDGDQRRIHRMITAIVVLFLHCR